MIPSPLEVELREIVMKFRMTAQKVDSLKEFAIRAIKKQLQYTIPKIHGTCCQYQTKTVGKYKGIQHGQEKKQCGGMVVFALLALVIGLLVFKKLQDRFILYV